MALLGTLILCLLSISFGDCGLIRAAPYYMPFDNDPQDVNEVIKATGIKHFILAFVLAPDAGGCVPTWDGNTTHKVCTRSEIFFKYLLSFIEDYGNDELVFSTFCPILRKVFF